MPDDRSLHPGMGPRRPGPAVAGWRESVLRGVLVLMILVAASASRAAEDEKPPPMAYAFETRGKLRVLWLKGDINEGSAANVGRALNQTHRYDEVWLDSGGGDVAEGFQIGQHLKRIQATVRVPNLPGVMCASSCTNLMLGGYNRTVERGAKFYVHAKSAVRNIAAEQETFRVARLDPEHWKRSDWKKTTFGALVRASATDPTVFRDTIEERQRIFVESAVEMVAYFQEVLGGTPNQALYGQLANRRLPAVYGDRPPWTGLRDYAQDLTNLQADGLVALQEILTQVELDTMRRVRDLIRSREPELGRGAKVANRIFEATLACRIQDLCLLPHHELASLGYHNFDRH